VLRTFLPISVSLSIIVACSVALGYTGGPIRIRVEGYDSSTKKVYYRLHRFDESGLPPEVYSLRLNSTSPNRPFRERSLEVAADPSYQRWSLLTRRLEKLGGESSFKLEVEEASENAGVDSTSDTPVSLHRIHVRLRSGSKSGKVDTTAYCEALVTVKALYRIPGRKERLSILSFIGRAYGCEEVDVPVLLR